MPVEHFKQFSLGRGLNSNVKQSRCQCEPKLVPLFHSAPLNLKSHLPTDLHKDELS